MLVADHYRFLEDPNSRQTKEWTEAESRITERFLGSSDDV
jgi:prolyl oligopeptidase PreP (S9A serine peptidase family)